MGIREGTWTPKQMREYNEKERIKQELKTQYEGEVNYNYGRIFENAENLKDSLEIYEKYGLPIKLLEPSLEQKERASKQSRLLAPSLEQKEKAIEKNRLENLIAK